MDPIEFPLAHCTLTHFPTSLLIHSFSSLMNQVEEEKIRRDENGKSVCHLDIKHHLVLSDKPRKDDEGWRICEQCFHKRRRGKNLQTGRENTHLHIQ